MSDAFHLLDLTSQALAVQKLLAGRSQEEKLAWLTMHGRITSIAPTFRDARPYYMFESSIGLKCLFFIEGDEFVFIGDHTTYRATTPNALPNS